MTDPRLARLAEVLTSHSTRLQKGERVLIEAFDVPETFVNELIAAAVDRGAIPIVETKHNKVLRQLYRKYGEDAFRLLGEIEKYRMERMDAYIGVRGNDNICEMSDVPGIKMNYLQRHIFQPVHHDIRLKTKWVVLRYPNSAMAQQAGMSTEAFEDFYFEVCTMNYGRMTEAMQALKAWMESTDRVHILGPETDLSFSIKGMPAVPCGGEFNIPDGECFTAPVRNSVNGIISFNAPTIYQGVTFSDVKLEFRNGRIIDATAESAAKSARLNEIFNTDEGARYVGEFSLGFNPFITRPMLDILFDEKIAGSFHLTPGNAYENADNGNRSQIHWDMVMIQTPEYGGGEIWFDGELVRKDGRFVPSDLQPLNPENLTHEYDDFAPLPMKRRRSREKTLPDEVLV
ncbi:MAG: aminopeptidase [candidate division KSB1 bacterium]|nr:aminopeptidase [candidate division KSB1 bacterium]MDZ7303185.1 aminopeptidase [candidate division KSB1 bacterium]MDZ7310164.1 aminopeptidase [candidate division KSB1 bacterium]